MKRFAALAIAVLAAITVSAALVGCTQKDPNQYHPNPPQSVIVGAEFDGGSDGVYSLYGKEVKTIELDYTEKRDHYFNIYYIFENGKRAQNGWATIKGKDEGEHRLSLNTHEFPVLIVKIKPKSDLQRFDAEVSFDPKGAISVVENEDGLQEFTYVDVGGGIIQCPDMILRYDGITVTDPYNDGFLGRIERIDDGEGSETGDGGYRGAVGTYKMTFLAGERFYEISPRKEVIFNEVYVQVIVKILPKNETETE